MTSDPTPKGASGASRARMVCVTTGGFVSFLALSGLLTYMPLFATGTLGIETANYARLMTLRMVGITVAVILSGALGDRLGIRRVGYGALAIGGVGYACFAIVSLPVFLVLVPLVSGLLSTAFVNLNQLTQLVDERRQGVANTWYRAGGATAGILAPLLLTRSGIPMRAGMLVIAVILLVGAWAVRRYPMKEKLARFQGWREEAQSLIATYSRGLRHRQLMVFLNLILVMAALFVAIETFSAIRITKELDQPDYVYGQALAASSLLSLGAILLYGLVLDRWTLRRSLTMVSLLACLGLLGMGCSTGLAATIGWYLLAKVSTASIITPMSMWLSRYGRETLNSAFALHKVMTALYMAVATLAFGWLEPALGIRGLFVACAVVNLALLVPLSRLPEPGRSLSAG